MNRPSTTRDWVLVLWSVYIAAWAVASSSGPTIVAAWWLAGVGALHVLARLHASRRA